MKPLVILYACSKLKTLIHFSSVPFFKMTATIQINLTDIIARFQNINHQGIARKTQRPGGF